MKVLIFEINNQKFAINIENVYEIVNKQKISEVPVENKKILGLTNIREEVISVLNSNLLLDVPVNAENKFFVVIGIDGNKYILTAENVDSIVDIDESYEAPKNSFIDEMVETVYNYENNIIMLISMKNILKNCKNTVIAPEPVKAKKKPLI